MDRLPLCILMNGVCVCRVWVYVKMVCTGVQGGVSEEGGRGCAPLPSWPQLSHCRDLSPQYGMVQFVVAGSSGQ